MKLKIILSLLFLLCILNAISVFGANKGDTVAVQSTAINGADMDHQLLFLEWKIWQSKNDTEKTAAIIQKSLRYAQCQNYAAALQEANRTLSLHTDSNTNAMVQFNIMEYNFMLGNCSAVYNSSVTSAQAAQMNRSSAYFLMQYMSLLQLGRFKQLQLFVANNSKDSTLIKQVNQLPISYDYIDPMHMSAQSAWLPGLGMLNAGYPLKGSTSLLLNGASLAFLAINVGTGFPLTGIVTGGLSFFKFYSGGQRFSAILAEERNQKKISKLKEQYRKILFP